MSNIKDYANIAVHAVSAFGNDGKLDEHELAEMLAIATEDRSVNEDEARVLRLILSKLKPSELTYSMREEVRKVEREHSVELL